MVKIFSKIRASYGERYLAKKSKTLVRHKQTHNFNTARNIGILFDAGIPTDLHLVKEFIKYLSSLNISCSALGFQDEETISSDFLFLGNIIVFCQKDLDFFFRPAQADALGFMSNKFDMLIDLSLADHYPLRYVCGLSPAVFKVGKYTEGDSNLDFMIDIHSRPSLEFLIEQIKNYVSILNNPKISSSN